MRKQLITTIMLLCLTGAVQAAPTFDFEDPTLPSLDEAVISTYMTNVYGSPVTSSDGVVRNNSVVPVARQWVGNDTNWLRTNIANDPDMEIEFVVPIGGILGNAGSGSTKGYVFNASAGDDFQILAYGAGYGDVENPNAGALVDSFMFDGGSGLVNIPNLFFDEPVYLLVISDDNRKDVGIDDIEVIPVPEPGAVLLGSFGLGLVGWMRRRRTL